MGQQFYVIRNNPAPGTPAFQAKQERDKAKALKHGEPVPEEGAVQVESEEDRRPVQRQQPKKQSREQRKKGGGKSGPPRKGGRR